ncbi:MAG TPA: hypothetical protein VHT30_04055 [Acidimicrobiales bacterium]|nr:hypothetical protein [Acidimicrobiales bacterium]
MNTTSPPTNSLDLVAQSVESLHPADAPSSWTEILGPPRAPEGVRWHPDLTSLIGFVAPPDCQAIVTVGGGTARGLEGDPAPASSLLRPGERRRCRAVFLLTRDGEAAGYLRMGAAVVIDQPATAGRIPDVVRRALGLPTPPPDEPTDRLMAQMWLREVAVAGRAGRGPLSWAAVARHHPAMRAVTEAGLHVPADDMMTVLRVASEAWTWTRLLEQAAEPGWLADLLPPGAGEWMDEGILARWLLGAADDVASLLDQVTPLLSAEARRRLEATLHKLDVLGPRQ